MSGSPLVPHPHAVLFRGDNGSLTGGDVLSAAHRLAAQLPCGPIVNLCRDRCRFTALLLATILRGARSLLVSDRSPGRLAWLLDAHPGAIAIGDEQLPRLDWSAMPGQVVPTIPDGQAIATVFTSGSTGVPVAHEKLWGALVQRSLAGAAQFGLTSDPVTIVGTVPPQHMYGFETTILLPLHAGLASVSADGFYPADIRDALAAAPGRRVLVTTPLQMRALLQSGIAPSGIGCVISATAPLETALAAEAEARWDTRVEEIYGATEIGSIASRRTVSDEAWSLYPGVSLHTGADGGVAVLAPPARPQSISDVIERVGETRFRLLGRPGDLLKLGGKRASLAGLNAILAAIPGVADGVFMVPDATGAGAVPRMQVFVVAPGRSAEEVLAELRRRIDPAFLPRRVVRVDALPRNALGKITRNALADLQAGTPEPACVGAA